MNMIDDFICMAMEQEDRDASSSIRGFVYQNLIAIDEITEDSCNSVICEFLEDVTAFHKDKTKIIQAKYYNSDFKSDDQMSVFVDLYCIYLSSVSNGINNIVPILYLHSPNQTSISKPSVKEAKEWLDHYKDKRNSQIDELKAKGKTVRTTKADKNISTLLSLHSNDLLNSFIDDYQITLGDDIKTLSSSLSNKLKHAYSGLISTAAYSGMDIQSVLLGLTYQIVLSKYYEVDSDIFVKTIKTREIKRPDLDDEVYRSISNSDESAILSWITTIIKDLYSSILYNNPSLSDKDALDLSIIMNNTDNWLSNLLSSKQGQFKFINTYSLCIVNDLSNWEHLSVNERVILILKNTSNISSAIRVFWKIILNIYRSTNNIEDINPEKYVDGSYADYICLKFPKDFVNTSVILPAVSADNPVEQRVSTYSRLWKIKPQKWFMKGDRYGRFQYSFNPADITEEDLIEWPSDIDDDKDTFYLECMNCINTNSGKWKEKDADYECIFSTKCNRTNKSK